MDWVGIVLGYVRYFISGLYSFGHVLSADIKFFEILKLFQYGGVNLVYSKTVQL